MADNNKEVVRVLNSIAKELNLLNRNVKAVANEIERKQFSDWVAPPRGSVYQNLKGCTMLNSADFEEIYDVWCKATEEGISREYKVGDEE